jgi:hypothetical protein
VKRLANIVVFLIVIGLITAFLVLYARGYRPNFANGSLEAGGIISVESTPDRAKIVVDGEEKGETNLDLNNISPGKHKISVSKEGFSTWEREILVEKEVVNRLEVLLFPLEPSLSALTFIGVNNPVLTPDGRRIIFAATGEEKGGLWSYDLSARNLPLLSTSALTQIVRETKELKFVDANLETSPDSRQVLITLSDGSGLLLAIDRLNENPKPLDQPVLNQTKNSWKEAREKETVQRLEALGQEAAKISLDRTIISFSADGSKFIARDAAGLVQVFDFKPPPPAKERYLEINLPAADQYLWYPDGNHLVLVANNLITMMDLGANNFVPIYSGRFEKNFVAPSPDGSKLVIVNSFNTSLNPTPNLYAIELR